jgi:hypothetical protein
MPQACSTLFSAKRFNGLRDQKAAVYDYSLPGEVITSRRCKKNSSTDNVGWETTPAHRNPIVKRGREGGIIEPHSRQVGFNVSRGETVDADAFARPLDGQSARHSEHAPLARRIGSNVANAHLAGDTADVDDLALTSIILRSKRRVSSQSRPTAWT